MPLPAWYTAGAPRLAAGAQIYIDAFWELSTERDFGYAMGPIPWSKIMEYADRAGLDAVMNRVFLKVVRELDEEYQKIQKNNQKQREADRAASKEQDKD